MIFFVLLVISIEGISLSFSEILKSFIEKFIEKLILIIVKYCNLLFLNTENYLYLFNSIRTCYLAVLQLRYSYLAVLQLVCRYLAVLQLNILQYCNLPKVILRYSNLAFCTATTYLLLSCSTAI